nr:PREDICTED: E3 ubiquitin-protein ligase ARIH1 [Latimeria chalumnae]|eukprot:XP_014349729.1 PREDICTED: E3 ubiquitin-protein ligase ARIH1 [Latimeria chalumnae]
MVCRNQNCKAEFCWVCLGPWEPHGSAWYNCNRYNEDDAKAARDAQERSRAALQRYLFYCNRYMNHMQSLRFEHKLYAQVKQKMEEMQQHNMSWIEVQFLKKAVDVLCQCRATLMYTYVFAFYLKKNNQSIIFENNQADLENATEVLSGYLERDISQDSLQDIKQKVQDKYRRFNRRLKIPFCSMVFQWPPGFRILGFVGRVVGSSPAGGSPLVDGVSPASPATPGHLSLFCFGDIQGRKALQMPPACFFTKREGNNGGYCESRRKVLLQHVHEGYEKDLWEYIED